MRRNFSLFIVCYLSVLSGCCLALRAENLCDAAKASFSHIVPTQVDSVGCIRLPGSKGIYVASWTTKQRGKVASHVRLIDASGQTPHTMQRIELPDAFGAKLSTEDIVRSGKASLVLLVTDFGAAAAEVRVETYKDKHLHEVFRGGGDSVELLHLNGESLQIAVHHRLNAIDIPDLYQMENERFVKCDADYPRYYRQLLENQHLSRDSTVAPSLTLWFARLLELSGDQESARKQRMRASSLKP